MRRGVEGDRVRPAGEHGVGAAGRVAAAPLHNGWVGAASGTASEAGDRQVGTHTCIQMTVMPVATGLVAKDPPEVW